LTLADARPLDRGSGSRTLVIPEGYPFPRGQASASVMTAVVDENYFETMNTTLTHGRGFLSSDDGRSRPIAVVNEVFASTYWPNQDAIGKRLRLNNDQGPWLDVVGVARTEKYGNVLEAPAPFIYMPFALHEKPQMSLLVETVQADAAPLATPLRDIVRVLDV